ncbi:glycosyltransferase family 1 protein [Myxacorys almedinensis A]|uniref:Glycosyltransferase family 1 protein n=1 Tax=Myxacorys almedinensis A TaxID=2690445 RepID=A0A8J8CI86_9CYAN|nr:glycosyltransferase family 1 protein [Myxacorys almedinensis A]
MTAIVPQFPPSVNGVGDYGVYLAQQLHQDQNWTTRFVVGDPNWSGTEESFFQATPVEARSHCALQVLLPQPPAVILLHYVGHGYARRGCPVWLVNALEQWCRSGGHLVTMFHELYATKPLLSSASLTAPMQKHLAIRLMHISDRCLTSRQEYAATIRRLSPHQDIPTVPIFSNVGEVSQPQPLEKRSRRLVVFGGRGVRSRVYRQSRGALEKVCCELGITEIIDIGAKLELGLDSISGSTVTQLGVQPAREISRWLSDAIAGFVDYPIPYLGKSGIFAAYCAHGVIPIVASPHQLNEDGLHANQQFWWANHSERLEMQKGQAIADAAHAWYQVHCLKSQAQIFADCLRERIEQSSKQTIVMKRIV